MLLSGADVAEKNKGSHKTQQKIDSKTLCHWLYRILTSYNAYKEAYSMT